MSLSSLREIRLVRRALEILGTQPPRQQVAALPWRKTKKGELEIMLITSRDTGRWVLPKGWVEKEEDFCDAAAREAGEEAGLRGAISSREAGRYTYAKCLASGDTVDCEVRVYPLEVAKVSDRWKEHKQRKRKWVAPSDAAQMVAEPDLSQLIASFPATTR